jgi:hypothetical protein
MGFYEVISNIHEKTIVINFMSFVKEPLHVALHKACMYTTCVVGKALGRGHYENKGPVCQAKLGAALILVAPSPEALPRITTF